MLRFNYWNPCTYGSGGQKSSRLSTCKCFVPALQEKATSLNHAYKIISKKVETKRPTNSGNVFKKVYYLDQRNRWQMLEHLRKRFDAQFERRYTSTRGEVTSGLALEDSIHKGPSALWEDYEGRMVASIATDGLTIAESFDVSKESTQTIKTSSVRDVLFELIKERFTSAVEFDIWLDKKGIDAEHRFGLPEPTDDSDEKVFRILDQDFANDKVTIMNPAERFLSLSGNDHKRVAVDEKSYRHMDEFFAAGWIRVGDYFKRRPLHALKPIPTRNIPMRIRLGDFYLSKQQRRVLRKNADLNFEITPLCWTREEEDLFDRHKSRFDFRPPESIYNIVPLTSLTEIKKLTVRENDRLVAVSYLDVGKKSTYSIYGVFEPAIAWRSLGILSILKEIEFSIYEGKEFYYLGFVYDGASIYDYKKHFRGLELFDWKGNWISADATELDELAEANTEYPRRSATVRGVED
jgi:arginyl-tRNA--protein-N-Asp/Glu arginylyltransferase